MMREDSYLPSPSPGTKGSGSGSGRQLPSHASSAVPALLPRPLLLDTIPHAEPLTISLQAIEPAQLLSLHHSVVLPSLYVPHRHCSSTYPHAVPHSVTTTSATRHHISLQSPPFSATSYKGRQWSRQALSFEPHSREVLPQPSVVPMLDNDEKEVVIGARCAGLVRRVSDMNEE